jgi:hypothetical protein
LIFSFKSSTHMVGLRVTENGHGRPLIKHHTVISDGSDGSLYI